MKRIPLTKEMVALVDDEDFCRVMQYKWFAMKDNNHWYASSKQAGKMHRFILKVAWNEEVDHANRDGLDNRRSNLRIATRSQNIANSAKWKKPCDSKYKGVTKCGRKWQARIGYNYRQIHLGVFAVEEDAAKAYDEAAVKYFGEFARTNFAKGGERA